MSNNNHDLLRLAIKVNNLAAVKIILAHYGAVSKITIYGLSVLHWAALCARVEIVEYLLGLPDIESIIDLLCDKRRASALHYAVESKSKRIVKMLCERKANVNLQDGMGYSPLIDAVISKTAMIMKILLLHGADLSCKIASKNSQEKISCEQLAYIGGDSDVIAAIRDHQERNGLLDLAESPLNANIFTGKESLSAHAYLKAQGYSDEELKKLKPAKPSFFFKHPLKNEAQEQLTWCNKSFCDSTPGLVRIDIDNQQTPYFLYIPCSVRIEAELSDEDWSDFLNKRIKFDNCSIKKLSKDKSQFKEIIKFGDTEQEYAYDYELKINKVDRILLFTVQSDEKNGCLLVGARFLQGGLHNQGHIAALGASISSKRGLVIEMPVLEANKKVF